MARPTRTGTGGPTGGTIVITIVVDIEFKLVSYNEYSDIFENITIFFPHIMYLRSALDITLIILVVVIVVVVAVAVSISYDIANSIESQNDSS